MLLKNLCESFNAAILDARQKPIITLLEKIRYWLMSRYYVKRESVSKWVQPVGKMIMKVIEKNKSVARHCQCTRADTHRFQMQYKDFECFSVNLVEKVCTCRLFQLSGIPCGHALSAIWSGNLNIMDFVDVAYKKDTLLAQYIGIIEPMPSPDKWPNVCQNPIHPPSESVFPGRPKKARRRETDEPPPATATKASRVGQPNHCSNCGSVGHSKRSCKNPAKDQNVKGKRMGRPPKKNPTPSTVRRNTRRAKQQAREDAQGGSTSQTQPQQSQQQ
ncbi:uncharacterized protein LOC133825610 [Humulus lupulus]|uniref:uncharacterized protein LOC133825610 n=1 Tax=Humulus lupulus TaxID=3486 RepID=UPI002B410B0E|nr:uncharacterized protein LOC133825610 [Humulus lupulus]